MSKVKRYYIGRNRDHEKVMTEITDNDKRFIKIPDDEWVRATDYDEAEQSRDINHAAAKMALDQRDDARELLSEAVRMIEGYKRAGWLTNPAALEQANDFMERAKCLSNQKNL